MMLEHASESVITKLIVARGSRSSFCTRICVAFSWIRDTIACTSSFLATGVTSRSTSDSRPARGRGSVPRMVKSSSAYLKKSQRLQ